MIEENRGREIAREVGITRRKYRVAKRSVEQDLQNARSANITPEAIGYCNQAAQTTLNFREALPTHLKLKYQTEIKQLENQIDSTKQRIIKGGIQ